MNGHPPGTQALTIQDLLQMRLALDTIKNPSQKMKESIAKLDEMIHNIVTTFTQTKGPTQ